VTQTLEDIGERVLIPESWRVVPLETVATINPRTQGKDLPDDLEVTFLPMKAVQELSGKFDTSDTRALSEVRKGYTSFQDGDVVFAKITPCMENGKAAVVKGLKNGIGYGSTEFHVVRLDKGISNAYLFYFLTQEGYRKAAERNMTGSAGQRRVPTIYLSQTLLPIPPEAEQRRIVAKIEELFTKLEAGVAALKKTQVLLKRYRQAVLKAAVEGELSRAWREANPDVEPAEKLLKVEGKSQLDGFDVPDRTHRNLPSTWVEAPLEALLRAPMINGLSVKGSDNPPGIAALKLSAMSTSGFNYRDVRYLPILEERAQRLYVQEGDFFVSRGNGTLSLVGRGTLAQAPLQQPSSRTR